MDELRPVARMYLLACDLLGLAAGVWLIQANPGIGTPGDWRTGVLLAFLAGVAQVLVVPRTKSSYSDHLTPALLFAGFLLLPPSLYVVLVALTFLPEWIIYRRAWYVQTFNVVSWWIALALGQAMLTLVSGQTHLDRGVTLPAPAIFASIVVVLGAQTLLIATALRLARGQSFTESQLFAPEKLIVEVSLLCIGLVLAVTWLIDPLYSLAALLPLIAIFQALHVPNLRSEATTDPKTGLANIRHFTTLLERELDRSRSNRQPVSLLMCDLDYLRNINNTYGHQAGDVVLNGIAGILRRHIRGCDLAGRFGGEEFCVLLPETDGERAYEVAERIRQTVEQARFTVDGVGRTVQATISIGVASCPPDGQTVQTLLHEADLAVYGAKRSGRNRVVVAGRASRELVAEWARENLLEGTPGPSGEASNPIWHFVTQAARLSNVNEPTPTHEHRLGNASGSPASPEPATGSTPTRPPIPRSLALFIGVISVAGPLGLVPGFVAAPSIREVPWVGLAFFAVLTVLSEHLAVEINRRGKTSVSAVILLAASLLYGAWGSLVTALAFAVWAKIRGKSMLHRMLFNFGMILLSAEAGSGVFSLLTGGLDRGIATERMLVPAILAGAAYFAVNHLLLSFVRGMTERRSPAEIWRTDYHWLLPHYAVFGALALIVALGYQVFGASGVLALMAPVAMMHLAIKQYMEHTAWYVAELEGMNQRLSDSYEATLQALTRALDTRDEETEEHSQRVRRYAALVARSLGLSPSEMQDITRGALLHDVGKIGVPDAILLKPGKLTAEEQALMRKHPQIGYSMIAHIPFLAKAAEVVLHHHEAYNGSGYPSGLAGERIPLGARVFAVVDTFDAMTSDRPYRRALPYSAAIAEIERCRGTQFDPRIVDALVAISPSELREAAERTDTSPMAEPASFFATEASPIAAGAS